jgi:hypothetical protein
VAQHFDGRLFLFDGRFCVVTPRTGTRLLQTGDEKLLKLAKECESSPFVAWSSAYYCVVKIPIIAVFTKYDLLINQFYQRNPETAENEALASFDRSAKDLQDDLVRLSIDLSIPCVKVSTKETSAKRLSISWLQLFSINANYITETLIDLANFTRDKLKDVERELEVLWVAAQQVNALQKVEVSIR